MNGERCGGETKIRDKREDTKRDGIIQIRKGGMERLIRGKTVMLETATEYAEFATAGKDCDV